MKKLRIGILGMGGVGTFIGTQLLKNLSSTNDLEVICICRGKTKENIKKNGLVLKTTDEIQIVQPHIVSDEPNEIGKIDLLFITTKSCDLEEALSKYSTCLNKDSIILPLLNGVNIKELVAKYSQHPTANILEGCIYIISNIESPGVAKHAGGPGQIFYGNEQSDNCQWIEERLKTLSLKISFTKDIKTLIWKKYLFVSSISNMTCSLGITMGQLRDNSSYMSLLRQQMEEIVTVAQTLNINLSQIDIEEACQMLQKFPSSAKTSLQLDLEEGKNKNEKTTLIDYVKEIKKQMII